VSIRRLISRPSARYTLAIAAVLLAGVAARAGGTEAARPRSAPPHRLWYRIWVRHSFQIKDEEHFLSEDNGHGYANWHVTFTAKSLWTSSTAPARVTVTHPRPNISAIQVIGTLTAHLSTLEWRNSARSNGYNPDAQADQAAQWDCSRNWDWQAEETNFKFQFGLVGVTGRDATQTLPDPVRVTTSAKYAAPEITCPVGDNGLGPSVTPAEPGGQYRYPGVSEQSHGSFEIDPRWTAAYVNGGGDARTFGGEFTTEDRLYGRYGDREISVEHRVVIEPREVSWPSARQPGTLYRAVKGSWTTSAVLELCGDGHSRDAC
jgi:hypothetical protein